MGPVLYLSAMVKQSLSIFDDDEEPRPRPATDPADDVSGDPAADASASVGGRYADTGEAADTAGAPASGVAGAASGAGTRGDPPADPPQSEATKPVKKRRGVLFFALLLLALVFAGAVGVAGFYATQVTRSVNQIQRQPDVMPTAVSRPPSATAAPEARLAPLNIVIMGTDSRGPNDRGRSDSLMVLHISGDRKNAYFISFPRDMWVDIPGRGKAKINAAYAWGGPALSVQTLEQITGTRMDHVALTNFDNFIKLVDVVGGVTVNNKVASSMKSESGKIYQYPVGEITLSGEAALLYCRERFDLPNGDFDRAGRQRDVLKAILVKAASPEVMANPAKVTELIGAIGKYVTVDSGMTTQLMLEYAGQMKLSGGDSIKSLQAPLVGQSTSTDGQWIAVYDPAAVATLGQAMREDTIGTYYEGHRLDYAKPLPPVPSPK